MHKFIDREFFEATSPTTAKQGFYFRDLNRGTSPVMSWHADHGLCGAPAAYRRTGTKIFVVNSDGRPLCTDAGDIQPGVQNGEVVKLIADYPTAAQITSQKWRQAD